MSQEAFAAEWIAAWNSHDLDRILSHYADDIVFESPASTRITGDPSGRVVGKAALADYWRQALERVPDLTFTLRSVYGGAQGVAIRYHSSRTGRETVEVLQFNEAGLATWAAAYYE
ncbi:MAG TPA: nuclear transport factor 2 family protein [Caulobacteraceae bacterium]